jgi:apolipoprotein N-acyltransferase
MREPHPSLGTSTTMAGAAAVVAGLGLGASFVDFGLWVLPWVMVAPLIALAETCEPRRAFRLGWLGGCAGIALAFSWLVHAFQVFGGFGLPIALALFAAPVAWMGLQIGCFTGLLAWLGPLPLGLAAPLTFATVEFLFPTLFPWRVAHTQYRIVPLLQSGELAGPILLGFVIVWVNAGWVSLLRHRRPLTSALALGAVAVLLVTGAQQRRATLAERAAAPPVRVGIVQGNVGVERKGDRSFFRRNLDDYRRLSFALAAETDLLIWPETVAQRPIPTAARVPSSEAHPFPNPPRPLVFGGLAVEGAGPQRRLYNSAFLLDRDGAITGRYDKRVLVPFGEYLPLADRFPWLRTLSPATGNFSPGAAPVVLETPDGAKIGPLICYEDVIPGPARAAVALGATLLVNLTNDAWYGDTAEPHQHQALAVWRAVEVRRDFVRATNTGLTAAIDATGAVIAEFPVFAEAAEAVEMRLLEGATFYARYGDVCAWGMVATWIAVALVRATRGRRAEG